MIRTNQRESKPRVYGPDDIDAFLVVCPKLSRVFWIPVEEATPGSGVLRLERPANNQRKRVKWAADYALSPLA
jgi:hypothetical protein